MDAFKFKRTTSSTRCKTSLPEMSTAASNTSADSTRHTFENNFGFFVQDSFRATKSLTLNYGLRYDYFGVIGEKNNLLSNITE